MADLIVILESDYAQSLEAATRRAPVWIVSSQANRAACEQRWQSDPHRDHRDMGAVTCFDSVDPEDRLGNLLEIVPQLATHHGTIENDEGSFPAGFVLEVVGLALEDNVTDALKEIGFTAFLRTEEGFQAVK